MNRSDRHDIDRNELRLIRAGHHLWRESRRKALTVSERVAFYAALETIWQAKRELRAKLAAEQKERGLFFAERMKAAYAPMAPNQVPEALKEFAWRDHTEPRRGEARP